MFTLVHGKVGFRGGNGGSDLPSQWLTQMYGRKYQTKMLEKP